MKEVHKNGVKWGMVIDLDKCTGCGACSVACQAENNISFRKDETDRLRRISWLEIYQISNHLPYPHTRVIHMPRPCMHCDHHTPCVSVCPASATKTGADGVVSQVYPRCFGCRYCMAACPYHARYFNWWDPTWPKGMEKYLNPDVSPRMRGVVEKCSFCYHRYHRAKNKAFMEGRRELREGEYIPACVEACPSKAMTFGNLNDPHSEVARLAKSPFAFRLLEKLGSEPKVYYICTQDWVRKQADNYLEEERLRHE
ncbi:MAG TPA: 4Fe-4S dicluster domain-containing protein [Syntrophaceae bacterium]|nr:4Fe-4S dicluster domain-containing protein [Syntrophaceae bacterium]